MLDRAFAIASIALALPGFIAIFWGADIKISVAFFMAFGLILVSWFATYRIARLPPFSVKNLEIDVSFPGGRELALMSKKFKIRANHRDQRIISFRNNSADGAFSEIRWNGERVADSNLKKELGDLRIDIPLNPAPSLFQEFDGTLEFDARDSFPGNTEFLIFEPDFPTKKAIIRVTFPEGLLCKNVESRQIRGSGEAAYRSPDISSDRRSVELVIPRPRLGCEYKLVWEW